MTRNIDVLSLRRTLSKSGGNPSTAVSSPLRLLRFKYNLLNHRGTENTEISHEKEIFGQKSLSTLKESGYLILNC